jgi:aryl-alcohol dehydrogenase-like predicted oxidoreductase
MAFGLPLFQRESFLRELRAVERMGALARSQGKSMAQLAIAWALGNPAVSVALVGARKPSEVQENVRAVECKLDAAIRSEIDRIFAEEGVPTYVDAEQAI